MIRKNAPSLQKKKNETKNFMVLLKLNVISIGQHLL